MGGEVVLFIDDLKPISGFSRCRICHEEEFESFKSLEAPCACSGTVKFAHRDCIQTWCNEKGNTTCEICLQQYEPGYTAPAPKKCKNSNEVMTIRYSLEISRREEEALLNRRIVEYEEGVRENNYVECTYAADRSAFCCRSLALAFTLLLLLRHLFALLTSGMEDYPFTILTIFILRASGIIIPMCIIIRTMGAIHKSIQRHYHHQDSDDDSSMSDGDDEENGTPHISILRHSHY
ncbi:uncharacterized protein LOC127097617 [Lathyrus oleraceus]|uniref:RING-CH-type domain-containing protein n=1 Tax=Pisum sativum TaxID=3888 RepID=A0A9D5A652_PEA|nr:uncharacterized protein LOC127097617 [Pisum sativum]KAI5399052.1 hypothetical protein KIW84_064427 [Pisum sativum]